MYAPARTFFRWAATGSSVVTVRAPRRVTRGILSKLSSVTVSFGRLFLCKLFSRSVDLGRGFCGEVKPSGEWLWARSVFRRR